MPEEPEVVAIPATAAIDELFTLARTRVEVVARHNTVTRTHLLGQTANCAIHSLLNNVDDRAYVMLCVIIIR